LYINYVREVDFQITYDTTKKEDNMARAKVFNAKALRAKKKRWSAKLGKISRELNKVCRHLKHM
jgi:hypothetical protein